MKYLLYFLDFWEGAVQLYNEGPFISLNSYSIPGNVYRFFYVYQDQIMEWNEIDSTIITVLHWFGLADLWNYSLHLNYLVKVLFILHSNWNALLMYDIIIYSMKRQQ